MGLRRVLTLRHGGAINVSPLYGSGILNFRRIDSLIDFLSSSRSGEYCDNVPGSLCTGRMQVATVGAILAALAIAFVPSAPRISSANYTPILPNGLASIGTAAALIMCSYLGYENTSNVAEEFRNPERDFHRSVVISVVLISALYLAVAVVTVGTGAYIGGGGVTPFAAMMSGAFGSYGGMFVAIL